MHLMWHGKECAFLYFSEDKIRKVRDYRDSISCRLPHLQLKTFSFLYYPGQKSLSKWNQCAWTGWENWEVRGAV